MKLSTWRPSLLSWLTTKIAIDSYFLQYPEQPGQTSLFLPPLRAIQPYESDNGYQCTAIQDIYVSTRYAQDVPYYQLPVATIEGTYSTISLGLLKEYQSIAELLDLTIDPLENAIAVEELPDGDWVVTIKVTAILSFVIEPEDALSDALISRINLGLYRADLGDFQDKTLDWSYEAQL